MAKKLFEFEDRNDAHQKLEKVLASGDYPAAECREEVKNGNGPTLYQVWDGSNEAHDVATRPPPEARMLAPEVTRLQKLLLSDEDVGRIADAILAKTKAQ